MEADFAEMDMAQTAAFEEERKNELLSKSNKELITMVINLGPKMDEILKTPVYTIAARQSKYNYKLSDNQKNLLVLALVAQLRNDGTLYD